MVKIKSLPIHLGMYCMHAKDSIPADVEDKVAQGILNALDKLKKISVDRCLAKLTVQVHSNMVQR